jgi:diguanylate cyclase (GGDEF)-like protein
MRHARPLRALLVEGAQPKLGVRALLDGHATAIELVDADDLAAALDHLTLASFDIVLFVISPVEKLGPKALRRVLVSVPHVPVIVLALVGDATLARQSIVSGAQDFWLSPDDSAEQLVRSIASAIARKSSLDQLVHRANYDRVTGLPNRYLFDDRLRHAAAQAERHDRPLAVLFVDLDHFKEVNDTLGHRMGDRVLKLVAERISGAVRRVDTAARIGGDEFAIILEGLERVEDASIVAQKVLDALAEPFIIRNHRVEMTASVGISLFLFDGTDARSLLDHADRAMYRAKRVGGNAYRHFTEDMGEQAFERFELLTALRRALKRNEFYLVYQPEIDLASGGLRAMEALLRWNHPQRGLLEPHAFIAVAEDSELIIPLGEWVLREVCRQSNAWRSAGLPLVKVGVNLCARQLVGNRLGVAIDAALKDAGLSAEQLEVELKEPQLAVERGPSATSLKKLLGLGVHIALDDFGDRHSDIGDLRQSLVETVKLDQGLIRKVGARGAEATIALAIIELAHGLGLTVVAEGVETLEQLAFLRGSACDAVQGHLICRPLGAEDMAGWLARGPVYLPDGEASPVEIDELTP